jgi:HAD superfamily hydrolase (TIGR01490 family)
VTESKLTIFDVDNTLAHCNISFAFGKYLYKKRFFSLFTMILLVCAFFLHIIKILPLKALHYISFYLLFYKASKSQVENFAQEFVAQEYDLLIRKELENELYRLKNAGAAIWLQSSSPDFVIRPLAKKLGVNDYFATTYSVDENGKFSKMHEIVDGTVKRDYLLGYLDENRVSSKDVTCYTDSIQDLPVLELVGRPIAVFPESKLKKIAQKNSWSIIE